MNALDSQMQSLTHSARMYGNKPANSQFDASQFDHLDVFARVGKNRDA